MTKIYVTPGGYVLDGSDKMRLTLKITKRGEFYVPGEKGKAMIKEICASVANIMENYQQLETPTKK